MNVKVRDLLERVWWTFVAAVGAAAPVAAFLDVEAWKAAVFAGATAAVNAVTVIARWRLSVLPDPGAGLGPS